jgi:hypothetical protein
MNVEWTVPALKRISEIKSNYFSTEETNEYRIKLVNRIEEKILLTGTLFVPKYTITALKRPTKQEILKDSYV